MNKALLHPDVQEFIRSNRKTEITRLVLSGSPYPDVSPQELAEQISGLNTAEKKLPTWFKTGNIIYPPKLNLEQTSSEVTAEYKASLVSGTKMADLTGGFGIDSYFFSKKMDQIFYCELNKELAELAEHNFKQLKANNIEVIKGNGLEFLKNTEGVFNWIYLDPARRDNHGGKVFRLADCTPDVAGNMDLIFEKADKILIKTSPLLDLKAGTAELKNVKEIHIVSVNNEVKELLWLLEKAHTEAAALKTINFRKNEIQFFEGSGAGSNEKAQYSRPGKYIYEPNPAIMKSGLFEELAVKTGTFKLHQHSHLYTSDDLKKFPGRRFKITELKNFNPKELKKYFKGLKANISTRNFPESVENLKKKFRIKDGGELYVFFTTSLKNEKIVLICKKIKED
ncbi:class I SAM-dependent methyltransferase [Salegentibacter chungangensis]|uniref:Class I SAM-dependent methyltransferase n=1 Tax=Salegentibacter chungangensis TaxID=1335724 RepID=A0ABW3NSE8_9FLAO